MCGLIDPTQIWAQRHLLQNVKNLHHSTLNSTGVWYIEYFIKDVIVSEHNSLRLQDSGAWMTQQIQKQRLWWQQQRQNLRDSFLNPSGREAATTCMARSCVRSLRRVTAWQPISWCSGYSPPSTRAGCWMECILWSYCTRWASGAFISVWYHITFNHGTARSS